MKYGEILKYHREKANLSQGELSKQTGITQACLSYYEANKRIPSIDNCIILADFYGISVDELIGHEVKKNW